jgi:hypothetical protein
MDKVAPYYKAVAGAVVAFLTAVITALDTGSHVTAQEWITAVIALIVAGGAVFAIPNTHPINPPTTPMVPAPPPSPGPPPVK